MAKPAFKPQQQNHTNHSLREESSTTIQLVQNAGLPKEARFEFVDFYRGIAVVLMVLFHFSYDLRVFEVGPVMRLSSLYWSHVPDFIGGMFFFIMGFSAWISWMKMKPDAFFYRSGFKILSLGACVSVATYFFNPKMVIWFGVLHGLGMTMLMVPFVMKKSKWMAYFSGAVLLAGIGLYWVQFESLPGIFAILNIRSRAFYSSDYYPLLPWSGVTFAGIAVAQRYGSILLNNHAKKYNQTYAESRTGKALRWLGRHSLAIYIIHQPVMYFTLQLLFKM